MGEKVIKNINDYIAENNISLTKLAEASGILYNTLWTILNKNKDITIKDYIAICEALNEPVDHFIPKKVRENE